MKSKKLCSACDAPMVEYRHTLSKGLISALAKACEQDGPFHLNSLGLTYNQQCNFQKLRYWGLVAKCYDPDGERNNGWWVVSDFGRNFFNGRITCARQVWTYRGDFLCFDGEHVYVSQVLENRFKRRKKYAAEAKVHYHFEDDGQGSLL